MESKKISREEKRNFKIKNIGERNKIICLIPARSGQELKIRI